METTPTTGRRCATFGQPREEHWNGPGEFRRHAYPVVGKGGEAGYLRQQRDQPCFRELINRIHGKRREPQRERPYFAPISIRCKDNKFISYLVVG
jgi:hypothetical protein